MILNGQTLDRLKFTQSHTLLASDFYCFLLNFDFVGD